VFLDIAKNFQLAFLGLYLFTFLIWQKGEWLSSTNHSFDIALTGDSEFNIDGAKDLGPAITWIALLLLVEKEKKGFFM